MSKLVDASERVKVINAVSLAVRLLSSDEMAIVGGVVSAGTVLTERERMLLAVLGLPAVSVKVPLATWICPLVVEFGVGVNVAV